MKLPEPVPGLVIRYAFLWSHEAEAGAVEAAKDRPCAIIVAVRKTAEGDLRVVVAPITHAPPQGEEIASSVRIPPKAAKAIGLNDGPHWLRADELNSFAWPGFDLRQIPGSDSYAYGMLPKAVYEDLRGLILEIKKRSDQKAILDRD